MSLIRLDLDQQTLASISNNLASMLKKLPDAIQTLEKKRKNFGELSGSNYQLEGEWPEDEFEDEEYDEDDEGEGEEYSNIVNSEDLNLHKTGGFFDIKEDEVYEDPLSTTPLDAVNIFAVVKQFIQELQMNNNQKFNSTFGQMNEDDQKIILDIMNV